ncbi:MAG: ABC transporter permease subunit [Treponema sp.]|jgi:putative aldouronate transport system permease protein|nr:ABC transporter permease subunit [Treponema sp.]
MNKKVDNVPKVPKILGKSSYFKRSWMLYLMLLLPIAFFTIFRYIPMTNIVIAFKNYNIFHGVWAASEEKYCHELELNLTVSDTDRTGATSMGGDLLSFLLATQEPEEKTEGAPEDIPEDIPAISELIETEDPAEAEGLTTILQSAGLTRSEGHTIACGRTICCEVYGHKQNCSHWVGFDWFKTAFQSRDFWRAIRNTLWLNFLDLLMGFPAPIILALLLNELIFRNFKRVTQTIIYLPHFLSWIIVSGIATRLLATETGVVNIFLAENLGMDKINFLMDKGNWVLTYILFGVWKEMGWGTIIYLAAITGINPELYEAAEVDGAGRWRKLWNITLPGIRPTIVILLIMNIGRILGIELDRPFTMANPIVRDVADVLSTLVYRVGIQSFQFSLTAAIGLFQSIICVIFLVAANTIARRLGERGIW